VTEHANLAAALAAFQAELPKIIKDETARVPGKDGKQGYTYGYADLAAVAVAVLPVLGKHGLAFTAMPTVTDKGFGLVYSLEHGASDQRREGFWPIQMTTPQQMGSAITYARRYALMAATGVFPDKEDDDGAAASQAHRGRGTASGSPEEAWESARPAQPTREQRVDAGHKAIAAATELAVLNQLKDKVDGYALDSVITNDDAFALHAAIRAREAELNGNQVPEQAAAEPATQAPETDTQPAPQPPTAQTGQGIRDEQKRKMFALFNQLGFTNRAKQMEFIRAVARRDMESRNDLTAAEAQAIIGAAETQIRLGAGKTNGHNGTNGREAAAAA
jgi:hypothetical protein